MKIPYNEVKKVVIVRTIYVAILALGFLYQRSFIVGKNPINVTIQAILYKKVSTRIKDFSIKKVNNKLFYD